MFRGPRACDPYFKTYGLSSFSWCVIEVEEKDILEEYFVFKSKAAWFFILDWIVKKRWFDKFINVFDLLFFRTVNTIKYIHFASYIQSCWKARAEMSIVSKIIYKWYFFYIELSLKRKKWKWETGRSERMMVCMCLFVCVSMCLNVCVREKVCVCVRVCVRERERVCLEVWVSCFESGEC